MNECIINKCLPRLQELLKSSLPFWTWWPVLMEQTSWMRYLKTHLPSPWHTLPHYLLHSLWGGKQLSFCFASWYNNYSMKIYSQVSLWANTLLPGVFWRVLFQWLQKDVVYIVQYVMKPCKGRVLCTDSTREETTHMTNDCLDCRGII